MDNLFVGGCLEEVCQKEDFFGGNTTPPLILKTCALDKAGGSVFAYNQLEVDPYSCTLVATYGALTDFTKDQNGVASKIMPYDEMKKTLERMKKDRKFTPGKGAYLEDGVRYALESFNAYFGAKIKSVKAPATMDTFIKGMSLGSSIVTGVKANSAFFRDMQDNGVVDTPHQVGNIGHAMRVIKINTTDDLLFKFANNYHGAKTKYGDIAKDVILVDMNENDDVLFNTAFYFVA